MLRNVPISSGTNNNKILLIGVDQAIIGLINKYVKMGELPNIKKMIEGGVYTYALSCPPCDTPTNWSTIATGLSGQDGIETWTDTDPVRLGVGSGFYRIVLEQ